MEYEKSCGAVVYRINMGKREYLIILNKKGNAKGHWGFPKGHVENNETELQTAQREIFEEVGIKPKIDQQFKYVTKYTPRQNVEKEAVYFAAEADKTNTVLQKSEVADLKWCSYNEAMELLTYDSEILRAADKYIQLIKN